MKSTNLCFNMASVWKFVIRNEMSYPYFPISTPQSRAQYRTRLSNLYWLSPQDEEGLGTLCQEPGELVDQDMLNLIRLLYPNADTNTVHARFDEHLFVLIARNRKGVEEEFGGALGFDLGDVMSLGCLRRKVGHRECSSQRRPNALEVRAK